MRDIFRLIVVLIGEREILEMVFLFATFDRGRGHLDEKPPPYSEKVIHSLRSFMRRLK